MNASDRVALQLGRAILRAEQLADDLAAERVRTARLDQKLARKPRGIVAQARARRP